MTASEGEIWASQIEGDVDANVIDASQGGIVRIDPGTNSVEQLAAPGVQSVTAVGDTLSLVVPGRRSDLLYGYSLE